MKKYTYCFGCDGKFGGSDGIASARRSSYFDLADDPEVSSEDLSAIEHFYAWNRKPLTTPLCWDCSLFRVLGYSMKYDDKGINQSDQTMCGYPISIDLWSLPLGDSPDPELTWCPSEN